MVGERVVLARETTPRGEIQLQRRNGAIYEIIFNGVFLMASYNAPSARALAEVVLARLPADRRNVRVLVGGLGMGYTLAATLADPRVGHVDVVEIEPLIVAWNREHLGHLTGYPLDDPRTHLVQGDLVEYLRVTRATYDALLLDVDNGPGWLSVDANHRLYDAVGLQRLRRLLTPGGVLAIWSSEASPAFLQALQTAFGNADIVAAMDHLPDGREITATIYWAVRDA
jgi:spermidine synthase